MSAVTQRSGNTYIFHEIDSLNPESGEQKGIKATLYDSLSRSEKIRSRLFEHTIEYRSKVYVVDWENYLAFVLRNKFFDWKNKGISAAKENVLKAYQNKAVAGGREMRLLTAAIESLKNEIWKLKEHELELVFSAIGVPSQKRKRILDCFESELVGDKVKVIEYKGTRQDFLKALDTVDYELPEKLPASLPFYLRRIAETVLTFLKKCKEESEISSV